MNRLVVRAMPRVTLLSLALGGLAPTAAQANDGFYVGIFGGGNFLEDQDYKVRDGAFGGGATPADGAVIVRSEFDPGWAAGLTMGYAMGLFRPELEFAYRTNDVDKQRDLTFPFLGTPVEADAVRKSDRVDAITGMLNLWFEPFGAGDSAFQPYVGGGVGALNYRLENPAYLGIALEDDDDTVFAWQLGAGVGFALGEHAMLSLDYRWVNSEDVKLEPVDDSSTRIKEKYEAHTAMLSLRFGFGGEEAPPPAAPPPPVEVVPPVEAAPPPPPPPPPPPAPSCTAPEPGQPFDMAGCKIGDTIVLRGVNFDFNKSSLTANARTILDSVAEGLNKRSDIKVELDGHTDSKGSDAYNLRLSQQRADSVRRYLAGKGIAADRLTAKGMGESAPVADNETDEGRELNRRVELKVLESSGGGVTVAPPAGTDAGAVAPAAVAPAADAPAAGAMVTPEPAPTP